jgi:hypothetical protein
MNIILILVIIIFLLGGGYGWHNGHIDNYSGGIAIGALLIVLLVLYLLKAI